MRNLIKKYASNNFIQNINGNIKNEGYHAVYDSAKSKDKGVVNVYKDGKKEKKIFQEIDTLDKFLSNFGRQKSQDIFDIMQDYIEKLDEITPYNIKKYTEKNNFIKKNLTYKKKRKTTRKK